MNLPMSAHLFPKKSVLIKVKINWHLNVDNGSLLKSLRIKIWGLQRL